MNHDTTFANHEIKLCISKSKSKSIGKIEVKVTKMLEQQINEFFSIWLYFHEYSRFTGQQGKGEGIYLTPLYHFHPIHRHLVQRAHLCT